jgi:hypothetical protein
MQTGNQKKEAAAGFILRIHLSALHSFDGRIRTLIGDLAAEKKGE